MWIEIIAAIVIVVVLIGIAQKVTQCTSTLSEIWEAYEGDRDVYRERLKDIEGRLDSIESSLDTVNSLLVAVHEAAALQLPKVDDSEIRQMIREYLQDKPAQQATYGELHHDLEQRIQTAHEFALAQLGVRGSRRAINQMLFGMQEAGELSFDSELVSLSRQAKE